MAKTQRSWVIMPWVRGQAESLHACILGVQAFRLFPSTILMIELYISGVLEVESKYDY